MCINVMEDIVKLKTCTKCKKEYPATEEYFYRSAASEDKLFSMCKKCKKESSRKSRSREGVKGEIISVVLTKKEKEIIDDFAKSSHMNTSTYVRKVVFKNASIILKDLRNYEQLESEVEHLSYYVSKVGTNINQIAKNLNSGKSVSETTIKKIIEVMEKLNEKMEYIEEQVYSVYKKWQ